MPREYVMTSNHEEALRKMLRLAPQERIPPKVVESMASAELGLLNSLRRASFSHEMLSILLASIDAHKDVEKARNSRKRKLEKAVKDGDWMTVEALLGTLPADDAEVQEIHAQLAEHKKAAASAATAGA